jgi:sec-independent protein translocase protein TatB
MFDFGVGYTELFLLALIAVVVIGPKDLPNVLRTVGKFTKRMRGMASEFQTHVDAAMRDAGVDDLKREAQNLKQGLKGEMDAGSKDMNDKLSIPSIGPSIGGAAAQVARPSGNADFDSLFGTDAAGETKVAGKSIEAPAASGT